MLKRTIAGYEFEVDNKLDNELEAFYFIYFNLFNYKYLDVKFLMSRFNLSENTIRQMIGKVEDKLSR